MRQTSEPLARAVAVNLFKLMAYKDEYEVARLHSDGRFAAEIAQQFKGDYKLTFHLAPPILGRRDGFTGKPVKSSFGPWMMTVFGLLAKFRGLRGTAFDIFGHTAERRMERQLIADYRATIEGLLPSLGPLQPRDGGRDRFAACNDPWLRPCEGSQCGKGAAARGRIAWAVFRCGAETQGGRRVISCAAEDGRSRWRQCGRP